MTSPPHVPLLSLPFRSPRRGNGGLEKRRILAKFTQITEKMGTETTHLGFVPFMFRIAWAGGGGAGLGFLD